jgi:dihydroorotase-like cyclic amidohydrolase
MEDELDIFMELYDNAIKNNKKIHIIWITLKEELQILEEYYTKLWFLREDINCFNVDFSKPLITVSVNIENLIWKGSDYKFWREKIFFVPPIRESWQNKAMFKWINRWVIAWINISKFNTEVEQFLWDCIRNEKILALTMTKILNFNLIQIWFIWKQKELIINY